LRRDELCGARPKSTTQVIIPCIAVSVHLLMIAAKNRRGQREGSPENGILPEKNSQASSSPRAPIFGCARRPYGQKPGSHCVPDIARHGGTRVRQAPGRVRVAAILDSSLLSSIKCWDDPSRRKGRAAKHGAQRGSCFGLLFPHVCETRLFWAASATFQVSAASPCSWVLLETDMSGR